MASNKTKNSKPDNSKEPVEIPGRTTKYDYVIDWIKESEEARRAQNVFVERAIDAFQGKPSVNRYKKTINSYIATVAKDDSVKAKYLRESLDDIPEKSSMVVHNAVEAVVSMAMGGVGQYEFGPYDPDLEKDDTVIDRLAAAAKHFYVSEKVDAIVPQYLRMAILCGASDIHLKQKNGKKCITLLESSQMYKDPKRHKTNFERFIGFSQRESFKEVKARTKKIKGGGYVLKTLNDAEVYITQIIQELNSVLTTDSTNIFMHDELKKDLDLFYKPIITQIKDRRDNKDDPNYMYDGDEVEVSYMYDLMNEVYLEVINRRYITVAKANPLKRDIDCEYTDAEGNSHQKKKTIKLEHPFIELPYMKTFWDTYPLSPLFYVLDDFDDLCAMESVLYHNLSIMAPITFIGQSSDAEKVSRVASVSGEIVEGLPQTFGVMSKAHDITAVVTAIGRIEEKIKRTLKAVDPFELQGMLGDRATAKEVVSASGQVSQGINQFLANIETSMATLGDKFIKLELIMNDGAYDFVHNGKYAQLSAQEMAGEYEVSAKLVSSIKLEQEANSRKALELIQYMAQTEGLDKVKFFGTTIPIVLGSLVSRETAESMVTPEYRPMPEETIARIKKQAEEDAKRDPVDKMDFSDLPEEELDKLILTASGGEVDPTQVFRGEEVMPPEVGGAPVNPEDDPTAIPPEIDPSIAAVVDQSAGGVPSSVEEAGIVANDPTGGGYVV